MRKTLTVLLAVLISVCTATAQKGDRHGHRMAEPAPKYQKHVTPASRSSSKHAMPALMPPVASPEQVRLIVESMRSESFDDKRYKIAILCAKLVGIPVEGLWEIAKEFSFDDNRLKFLEDAYYFCPDRERYWELKDCFSFSTNGDELLRFIESKY